MEPRIFWKGYLKLSLVTCAVAMSPATSEAETVRFHTLNRRTGNRVQSRYVDAVTGKPVKEGDEVKGYPRGDDDYVMLEDEEIEAVALESTRTIDIETFVPHDSIGWIWYDKPHFLVPGDKIGEEAFTVIREAMKASKVAGISRLVMYRRERAVLLEPRGKGIVLWTLRYGDEVRKDDGYFPPIREDENEPELQDLLVRLIKSRTTEWRSDLVRDMREDKLHAIIDARAGRKKPRQTERTAQPKENVAGLMEALRASLKNGK